MRRLGLLIAVFALGLVIACGGGDDDGGDDDNGGNGGGNNEPTATASSGDSNNDNDDDGDNDDGDNDNNSGDGSNSDFCSADNLDSVFDSTHFTNFGDLKSEFEKLDDALDALQDNAPNDIEDDVDTVVDTLRGLIELLEENDYNFVALASAQDDPRLLALDSDEFNEASDRVGDYCGFDIGDSGDGGGLSVPGGGGSPGGSFSVDLPEDFPSELVPPDSEVGAVVDAGFGLTVEFTSSSTTEEVKAYYEDELGTPTFADSESVLWTNASQTVTITGTDGNVTVVIIAAP